MSNLISRSLPHIRVCKCVWTPPFLVFQILILYAKNTNFATQKKSTLYESATRISLIHC